MIKLFFLLSLVVIKAENGSEYKPKSWNEAAYLSYIKNMALYPNMVPMSREEFDKLTINREGSGYDFSNFDQKFNNFENNQNQNQNFPNPTAQNSQSFPQSSHFANTGMPGNNQNMQGFTGGFSNLQNQNLGNGYSTSLAQNHLLTQLANQQNMQQQQLSFGGVLNQNHGVFGGALPPINLQTIEPNKFQSSVNAFMNTHGLNTDFMNLLREQQKQQSQTNQVVFPTTSYGSLIPGSFPQPPPQASSAQQDEVLKLMKLLLEKFDAQATTTTVQPTVQQHPEFEFKLTSPKQAHNGEFSDSFLGKHKERNKLNTLKEFDFGPGAKIISNPVKTFSDYHQHDPFNSNNGKYKDDDFYFHSSHSFNSPNSFENYNSPSTSSKNVNSPSTTSNNFNSPSTSFEKFNYPSTSYEKFNSPSTSYKKFNSPSTSFKNINSPPTSFKNINSPSSYENFNSSPTSYQSFNSKPKFRPPMKQSENFHHHKNSPNRFENGFEYPSLTYDSIRKPNPRKRNQRGRKARTPRKNPGFRLKFKKT